MFNSQGAAICFLAFILTGVTLSCGISWLVLSQKIGQGLIWLAKNTLKVMVKASMRMHAYLHNAKQARQERKILRETERETLLELGPPVKRLPKPIEAPIIPKLWFLSTLPVVKSN